MEKGVKEMHKNTEWGEGWKYQNDSPLNLVHDISANISNATI
jgi:hypothetical protein